MNLRVIVEADGGSRGNPGPGGFGALVRDRDSTAVLAERSGGLGEVTNNVAEYEGLLAGLAAALDLGAAEVDVRMDSKLVVEQLSGRWRVKHASLQPLARRAARLMAAFDRVDFEWVPRERNADADRLANAAMDRQDQPNQSDPHQPARTASPTAEVGTDAVRPTSWNGSMGEPTRFVLVRHGQTPLSVERRYSGRGDVSLTDWGQRQARAAAERVAELVRPGGELATIPVLTSPLRRTRETAGEVASELGAEIRVEDGLVETDFGAWEGLSFTEAAEQYADLHGRWLGDPAVEPPGGESFDAVFERVRQVRDRLLVEHRARTVVLVSHVTPIKAMLRLGLDVGPSLFYRLHLDLASVSIVEFYADGNASVRLVNDTANWR